ncbi:zinc carboxypeptidase family protein (macronuclear) [Tetrahymena thermophila SB210]|uniref:Zinc carboxypeptidase family protein n=1 Tax=Tetrahymena thermophila (strain SB210) TaxID=312017 RepID=I7LXW6_TETTS|nr:zinc carboxypeptidase family protein [Tetrahymena thermophila SB210]EAS06330.2 zinc carboxypeptidase family protein [Tetrahymena thermophila SB210]|eukprot:XP_001026575.2 zinc carboxypeptidase family protein [Tetrahymena thermophila SB210]
MWSQQIQISQFPDYADSEENESVCNSQVNSSKPQKESILPPPNPILNHRYGDDEIKTALKVVFKPLPEFSSLNQGEKLGGRHQKFKAKISQKYKEDEKVNSNQNQSDDEEQQLHQIENIDDDSLYSYYFNLKVPQVYKKFDNSNCNSIPYSKKKYFASYFCNIRNIISDQSGKLLMEQSLLKTNTKCNENKEQVDLIEQSSTSIIGMDALNQQDQLKTFTTEQSTPKNINIDNNFVSISQQLPQPIQRQKSNSKPGDLKFDSNFESGNLFAAFKISEKEYDLVLQNDINSKGNTQWFFFSVRNMIKNQMVKFNIVNFLKNDSLFNYGMKPVVFSQQDNKVNGNSWGREGYSITYEKSNILREGSSSKYYYKLSFSYQFKYSNDTVYFAQCFPYTYSDLQKFTTSLLNDPQRKCFISKKLLCYSIAKNKCDIFTVTSSSYFDSENEQKDKENISSFQDVLSPLKRPHQLKDKKKIVFLTARQHPGETPASYMIQGVIEFLTDPYDEQAAFLREHFIFKIIPMLNPDGVIHGNYRCSLSGVDLNRQWSNPSRELHPTIYFAKNAIIKYCTERKCRFLCDFHGHSKKMNSFFYGNPYEEDPYLPKIIPMECQNINKGVDFRSCTFKITPDKESTFRQALLNEIPENPFIYTFEASFYGTQIQYYKNHFSIDDFKNLGRDVIKGFYRSVKQEVEEEIRIYSKQEIKSKSTLNLKECDDLEDQANNSASENYKKMLQAQIDISGGQNEGDNNGSDSNPSEDELSKQELKSLNKQNSKKIIKKLSGQQSLLKGDNLIRQNSSQQNKRMIKTSQEDRNSLAGLTTVETSSTRVSSSKKIVLLYNDQAVQTESSFDFSKLQKFNNQREFFNNINNKACYTFDDQQNYGYDQMLSEPDMLSIDQKTSQFKNKLINQALQQRQISTQDYQGQQMNIHRPKTSNISGGRQNYGSRNASVSFHSKDMSSSEIKSSNLLNNNSSLNDAQIFQKRVSSFHSTSVGFYTNNQSKNQTNINNGIKVVSYNTQIPQHQLLLNIQSAMQSRPFSNRLFISGVKYSRENSKSKSMNNNDSLNKSTNSQNLKNKKHQEVQTQISIPIIMNVNNQSVQQQHWQQQMQQQYSQSNILNDIQNQQQNYSKGRQSQQQEQVQQNQQQEQGQFNQICMQTYNKNHLNSFSPKKKQYILCIQKKDTRSKSPQLRQPIEKRILNSPIQQNNLFKNMNQKLGREIIHSPIIKMFKNISNQNKQNNSTNFQQNNSTIYESLNQSIYAGVLDRNKSFSNNQNNSTIYQYTNSSSTIQKDQRSNSLNTTSCANKTRKQSSCKTNVLNQNSILFTEQASVDYLNNLQMNLQIRQCSPYKSPTKHYRTNSKKDHKYINTEPNLLN